MSQHKPTRGQTAKPAQACPDCQDGFTLHRRDFIKAAGGAALVGGTALAVGAFPNYAIAADKPAGTPESLVKTLYDSLTDVQKKEICFDWDHQDPKLGLLRTRVANNWHITKPVINTKFYTEDQRDLVRAIFDGMIQPEWKAKFDKQLEDDAGGFGNDQNIAIFGTPGTDQYEFVMTGRHMTVRCDGNSADHVAFGGPIFYGHAADGFDEGPEHEGNVFWYQALEANKLFPMLDGKQQKKAIVSRLPREQNSGFRADVSEIPGLPVEDMSADQKEHMQKILQALLEPYRQSDRDEVVACLKAQGGLDKCSLTFYEEGDLGKDRVWDCWRLEGPAFVWYFRGAPHVHVWVNVASDPSVKLNA